MVRVDQEQGSCHRKKSLRRGYHLLRSATITDVFFLPLTYLLAWVVSMALFQVRLPQAVVVSAGRGEFRAGFVDERVYTVDGNAQFVVLEDELRLCGGGGGGGSRSSNSSSR